MTALVRDIADGARRTPDQDTSTGHRCRLLDLLADPWAQLTVGAVGMLATAMPVRTDRVGQREARLFMAVNGMPDGFYVPTWMIMQFGALGAAPAAAGAALAVGDRPLAWRLAASGLTTWALAKLVKRSVRRPRPANLLAGTRCRGPEVSGLGYLSGHAGMATALGAAAFHRLSPTGRAVALGIVPVVGLSRAYVGAHLPLDIAGGAALGLAVEAAVTLVQRAALRRMGGDLRMDSGEQTDSGRLTGSCGLKGIGPRTGSGEAPRPVATQAS